MNKTTQKDWFDGSLAITNQNELCFVVCFGNDTESCFQYNRKTFICEMVDSYEIIRDDVALVLEFETDGEDNVSVVHSIECNLYEGN